MVPVHIKSVLDRTYPRVRAESGILCCKHDHQKVTNCCLWLSFSFSVKAQTVPAAIGCQLPTKLAYSTLHNQQTITAHTDSVFIR